MNELFEAMDYSVALLVVVHKELLPMKCDECSDSFAAEHQCLFSTDMSSDAFDVDKMIADLPEVQLSINSCPLSMIPPFIFGLYDDWAFSKEYPGGDNQSNVSSLMWWFIKRYKHYETMINRYQQEQKEAKNRRTR